MFTGRKSLLRTLAIATAFGGVLAGGQFALPTASAQATPRSGLLLGVYAFENYRGLRVTGAIEGYSAYGRLQANDVMLRVSDGENIYSVKTRRQIERAKDEIGPHRQAVLEYHRPGEGVQYLWVAFLPVDGGVYAHSRAEFKTEVERPGARDFFQGAEATDRREPSSDDSARDFWPGRSRRGRGN